MNRSDLSNYLIHWMSRETEEDALNSLHSIIIDEKINGSNIKIKGKYSCVCFTEAPAAYFNFDGRYWPFGIRVSKRYAFKQGARPVIYQRESEFN